MEQERYLEALSDVLLKMPPKQIEAIFNERLQIMRKTLEEELARRRAAHTPAANEPPSAS